MLIKCVPVHVLSLSTVNISAASPVCSKDRDMENHEWSKPPLFPTPEVHGNSLKSPDASPVKRRGVRAPEFTQKIWFKLNSFKQEQMNRALIDKLNV